MASREYWESELGKRAWTKHLREVSDRKHREHREFMMARDPNEHDVAYDILADHLVITESLHPDAKASLAAVIRAAVEAWLDEEADEFRNIKGEP